MHAERKGEQLVPWACRRCHRRTGAHSDCDRAPPSACRTARGLAGPAPSKVLAICSPSPAYGDRASESRWDAETFAGSGSLAAAAGVFSAFSERLRMRCAGLAFRGLWAPVKSLYRWWTEHRRQQDWKALPRCKRHHSLVTGCSQRWAGGAGKEGFVVGWRTQGIQEIGKIYEGRPHPYKSELRVGTPGAGPLGVVLNSNSFAAKLPHGHLTYLSPLTVSMGVLNSCGHP